MLNTTLVVTADWCAEYRHPPNVYNSWHGKTWCRCGDVIRAGDHTVCPVCQDLMTAYNWGRHEWCRQQGTDTRTIF